MHTDGTPTPTCSQTLSHTFTPACSLGRTRPHAHWPPRPAHRFTPSHTSALSNVCPFTLTLVHTHTSHPVTSFIQPAAYLHAQTRVRSHCHALSCTPTRHPSCHLFTLSHTRALSNSFPFTLTLAHWHTRSHSNFPATPSPTRTRRARAQPLPPQGGTGRDREGWRRGGMRASGRGAQCPTAGCPPSEPAARTPPTRVGRAGSRGRRAVA